MKPNIVTYVWKKRFMNISRWACVNFFVVGKIIKIEVRKALEQFWFIKLATDIQEQPF